MSDDCMGGRMDEGLMWVLWDNGPNLMDKICICEVVLLKYMCCICGLCCMGGLWSMLVVRCLLLVMVRG